MFSNKVSDQQSLVTEGSDVQQTEFQTGEWCVCGCFEQGGQYIVIDRTDRTDSVRRGVGLSGPKRVDVCVADMLTVLKVLSRAFEDVFWSFENVVEVCKLWWREPGEGPEM